MIRIRTARGEPIPVAPGSVVEFCDSTGALAVVIMPEPGGAVHIITAPDQRLNAHAVLTNQRVSDVKVHEPKKQHGK